MGEIKDGGPAFPFSPPCDELGRLPQGYPFPELGMTLRDWFAGRALAMLANPTVGDDGADEYYNMAEIAYRYADAMIAVRERK